ncbi:MAG: site-2 protease family protein [Nannocystales bacterium]
MENVLAFLLLIGPLIFFHELGHLIAAKLVDVKAVRFSIGFGPALISKRIGETEYCLAPIPLGGYVQLLGQHPSDAGGPDAERSLQNRPLWARYFVYFAGPAANLLLPLVVYFFYFVINITMVTPPIVGTVLPGTAADEAGLQQGDRIVAIDERDVRSWSEMANRVSKAPEQELQVQIERDGKRLDRVITPKKVVRRNALKVAEARGRLGVISLFYAPEIGVIDPHSPAFLEGLRTGDVITSLNGEPVRTIEELERMLAVTGDAVVRLTYLRAQGHPGPGGTYLWYESHHAQLLPRKGGGKSPTGILPARTFIRTVDVGSPADEAGLKAGDRILSVAGQRLEQWVQIDDIFSTRRDEAVPFEVQSPGGTPRVVMLKLGTRTWTDIYEYEHESPWLGANQFGKSAQAPPEPLRGRFTYAMSAAVDETVQVTSAIWSGLVRMLTFEMGVDQLSSVVGMYAVAGRAYEQGPGQFLFLIAMVSINLFIINLLPIPILDGGHILFFTIEAVRRRPLSQRAREIASAAGLVFILILLLVATRNDILRYIL